MFVQCRLSLRLCACSVPCELTWQPAAISTQTHTHIHCLPSSYIHSPPPIGRHLVTCSSRFLLLAALQKFLQTARVARKQLIAPRTGREAKVTWSHPRDPVKLVELQVTWLWQLRLVGSAATPPLIGPPLSILAEQTRQCAGAALVGYF